MSCLPVESTHIAPPHALIQIYFLEPPEEKKINQDMHKFVMRNLCAPRREIKR